MAESRRVGRIRALIVDDEKRARTTIRNLLELDDTIEVVGECWGEQTPAAIRELRPDLVFLDVQMPRMSGLQVLASLEPAELPLVVFSTAYDEYAVDAFEHAALDYLLKPFSDRRFFRALARAKDVLLRRETDAAQRRLLSLLAERVGRSERDLAPAPAPSRSQPEPISRIVVHDGGRILVFAAADVLWIEAAGGYARIHTGEGDTIVREPIGALEARLDPRTFCRIHRSMIVNVVHVREVRPLSHGDCTITLGSGTELRLSRTRREEFEARLAAAG